MFEEYTPWILGILIVALIFRDEILERMHSQNQGEFKPKNWWYYSPTSGFEKINRVSITRETGGLISTATLTTPSGTETLTDADLAFSWAMMHPGRSTVKILIKASDRWQAMDHAKMIEANKALKDENQLMAKNTLDLATVISKKFGDIVSDIKPVVVSPEQKKPKQEDKENGDPHVKPEQ